MDSTTLEQKVLFGYQGWFGCPGDGSPPDRWVHWFRNNTSTATNATVDYWPDTSELTPSETCATGMTHPDGTRAVVYSSYAQKTILRHFQWMEEYGIDGVFLQRFVSELRDPSFFAFRNKVAQNVRAGSEAYGRVFALMYDISSSPPETLVDDIKRDWAYLVDTLQITKSARYLHHKGRPVLGIWGLGFTHTGATADQAMELIEYFHSASPPQYRATLVGGTPTHWRTLSGDSKVDAAWAGVYRAFDVISPWTVGRYVDERSADSFRGDSILPDIATSSASGAQYMPVVWPGFSWHNLNKGSPVNQIPRNGGRFYWRQVYNAISAGATMLYVAMFDEVDEGTAMFKLAPTAQQVPVGGSFVPLDIDGHALPRDWYLRLGGETGKAMRGQIPLSPQLPIPLAR